MLIKNGIQFDEASEIDIYSMLIPPEEFLMTSRKGNNNDG